MTDKTMKFPTNFGGEEEFKAKVKVTRIYTIGFYSPDERQAGMDLDTILKDEEFGYDYDHEETIEVMELKPSHE